ncbi:MAG: ribonucleoside-triphosphate reductase, adenosylcobalamin-dependent [Planctomycetes bacterium]|nr:ribonucleoside-triphosphate reductase, adenosylcobalamin-dependent [Planctomycetota bacterium]
MALQIEELKRIEKEQKHNGQLVESDGGKVVSINFKSIGEEERLLSEPDWGALGKIVFQRSYSRIKEDGSRETWAETVQRVVNGNCGYVDEQYIEPLEPEKLFDLIYNFQFVPGGRHLWACGISGSQFISNCHSVGFDPEDFSRHFTYAFLRLMEGGGVGSSYSNRHLEIYPPVPQKVDLHIVCDADHKDYEQLKPMLSDKYSSNWTGCFEVEDSREGWAVALGAVLEHYYDKKEASVVLDVSHVRPSGTPLKTFGGTASGPAALAEMLLNVVEIINGYEGKRPDSELFLNVDHEIAKSVIAGGTRRSARMASKHWQDRDIPKFLQLKADGMSHWTANLSAEVDRNFWAAYRSEDKNAVRVMEAIARGIATNGEPGIINLTKHSEGELGTPFSTNPCGEITSVNYGSDGLNGLMACNLGSINLDTLADDIPKLREAIRLGSRFLLRATYADYPDKELDEVVKKERRIGLGLMGFHPFLLKHGCRYTDFPFNERMKELISSFYTEARESARDYAFSLRVPEPVKVTTVAPTGTTSKLPGTTPGIQPIEHKYFLRRVRFTLLDPEKRKTVEQLEGVGFNVIRDGAREKDTAIVEFPLAAPDLKEIDEDLIETAEDMSIEQMMEVQATLQDLWADNSISVTINFDQDKIDEERIKCALLSYGPRLKGVTLFPKVSNMEYAPIQPINKEEFMGYPEHLRQEANSAGECATGSCSFDSHNITMD